jgi:hypothetical protein
MRPNPSSPGTSPIRANLFSNINDVFSAKARFAGRSQSAGLSSDRTHPQTQGKLRNEARSSTGINGQGLLAFKKYRPGRAGAARISPKALGRAEKGVDARHGGRA